MRKFLLKRDEIMKKHLNVLAVLGLVGVLTASCDNAKEGLTDQLIQIAQNIESEEALQETAEVTESTDLSEQQKISRTFGHLLAQQLRQSEDVVMDIAEVIKGLQEELDHLAAPLTEAEYEGKIMELQKASFEKKAEKNLSLAEKFLEENKKKDGVVEVQPDKLQYYVVEKGNGPVLSGNPSALLHYKGSFLDGQVFSSSENNKDPILLPLAQTIPGFSLGMQGMREGETRIVYIHPDLAYGTTGQLPPNSLLIFEIKLIETIQDAEETVSAVTPEEATSEEVVAQEETVAVVSETASEEETVSVVTETPSSEETASVETPVSSGEENIIIEEQEEQA